MGRMMSFLSELANLVHLETYSDYTVQNPHNGWVVLSIFGPTPEQDVAGFWKYQRGCPEGEMIEGFLNQYPGRVELALVPSEEIGLAYQGRPQSGTNVLVIRPTNKV